MTEGHFEYDVGLSFAGEQREYVEKVAKELKSRGIRPFYDDYEKGVLWGKDLYAHLTDVYQHLCEYCVIFVSEDYAAKVWTSLERKSAQARALEENKEYILPARFDDTPIPGLLDTIGYIELSEMTPTELSDLIAGKLGKQDREHFLPPVLDRLFAYLSIEDDHHACAAASRHTRAFFEVLGRLSLDERDAVVGAILFGCPHDLPDNVHIHTDLLSRFMGKSVTHLTRLLSGISSLGFDCSVVENTEHKTSLPGVPLGDYDYFYLKWVNLQGERHLPGLKVARAMVHGAAEGYCIEHGIKALQRLDFSQLATATATAEHLHSTIEE